jgi:hypothetical protein
MYFEGFFIEIAVFCVDFRETKPGQMFAASFKSCPFIVNPDYFVPTRPLFVGACATCTPHSRASLANSDLVLSIF